MVITMQQAVNKVKSMVDTNGMPPSSAAKAVMKQDRVELPNKPGSRASHTSIYNHYKYGKNVAGSTAAPAKKQRSTRTTKKTIGQMKSCLNEIINASGMSDALKLKVVKIALGEW